MRAGGGLDERVLRPVRIDHAELRYCVVRSRDEILVVSWIVPGLVGSTETIELVDDAAIAVVDDQRCGRSRAAAKDDLVLRADRQSLRARAAGRGRNRERLLDMERRVLGNLENDARTSSA